MRKAVVALLVLVGLALTVILAGGGISAITRAVQAQIDPPPPGSISEMAQRASTNGELIVTSPISVAHDDVEGFDEARAHLTVLVARAVSSQSVATSPYNIETWFRLTVTETLSSQPAYKCVGGLCAPPAGVAPPAANEMLLAKAGGSLIRNGVTVNMQWSDFPDFTDGQSYVLFIDYDAAARVGVPAIGPVGVFAVDAYGKLTSVLQADTGLKADLAARFANDLNQLRATLNPPPAPTCDPVQEQNCYNWGGDWNPSTCICANMDPCIRFPWKCDPMTY